MKRFMIPIGICFFHLMTLFLIPASASETSLFVKTLCRWPDPVVMEGRLAEEMIGSPVSNLRLYAKKDGQFKAIRYQIDEMTEEGDWIFPEGPVPNGALANQKFDRQDKLLFMADDTGDIAAKNEWRIPGYPHILGGIEIMVADPVTGQRGWCYLLYFAEDPPPQAQLPDYVRYDYVTEMIQTDYYQKKFLIKNRKHTVFYKYFSVTEKAGGNETNFVDRIKARINLKMRFGGFTLRFDEESIGSDVLAYKRGPVRVIKRSEQYIKLPFSMKGMRLVNDAFYYRNVITVPTIIIIPFRLDRFVSSFKISLGTDFSPNIIPSKIVTPGNSKGYTVDGKMNEDERSFDSKGCAWSIITGGFGTFMTRNIWTPEMLASGVGISNRLIDDESAALPPENSPGSIGYLHHILEFSKVKKGAYYFFSEYYILPFYQPSDERDYIQYMDAPLTIKVGSLQGKSQVALIPRIGKTHR